MGFDRVGLQVAHLQSRLAEKVQQSHALSETVGEEHRSVLGRRPEGGLECGRHDEDIIWMTASILHVDFPPLWTRRLWRK